jgi:glycyl-tRNA synthetase beta chain
VRDGNERVCDRGSRRSVLLGHRSAQPLEARRPMLKSVTFQAKLGSLHDKSERGRARSAYRRDRSAAMQARARARRAEQVRSADADGRRVPRAAGTDGQVLRAARRRAAEVCAALEEQYWPRFAAIAFRRRAPASRSSIADKLDTLAASSRSARSRRARAIRSACAAPRSACCARFLERQLDLDLRQLIETAVAAQPWKGAEVVEEVWTYLIERLRSSYLEGDATARHDGDVRCRVASRTQSISTSTCGCARSSAS